MTQKSEFGGRLEIGADLIGLFEAFFRDGQFYKLNGDRGMYPGLMIRMEEPKDAGITRIDAVRVGNCCTRDGDPDMHGEKPRYLAIYKNERESVSKIGATVTVENN